MLFPQDLHDCQQSSMFSPFNVPVYVLKTHLTRNGSLKHLPPTTVWIAISSSDIFKFMSRLGFVSRTEVHPVDAYGITRDCDRCWVATGAFFWGVAVSQTLPHLRFVWRVSAPDVHPDHHPDGVHEPERHRLAGHALHPQGLRHHLPPGAERPEEEAQLQGRGAGGHRLHPPVAEI